MVQGVVWCFVGDDLGVKQHSVRTESERLCGWHMRRCKLDQVVGFNIARQEAFCQFGMPTHNKNDMTTRQTSVILGHEASHRTRNFADDGCQSIPSMLL